MTRRTPPLLLLLLALLAAPAAASAAPLPLKPKHDDSPLGNERLSNERTLTRWGYTNLLGAIRSKPSMSSKAVGKLRWNTEDGLPEVYIALQSRLARGRGPGLDRDPHPRPAERRAPAGCARSSCPTSRRSARS